MIARSFPFLRTVPHTYKVRGRPTVPADNADPYLEGSGMPFWQSRSAADPPVAAANCNHWFSGCRHGRAKSCIPQQTNSTAGRTSGVPGAMPVLPALARCYPEPVLESTICTLHTVYRTPHKSCRTHCPTLRPLAVEDPMRRMPAGLYHWCLVAGFPATRFDSFARTKG